VSAHRVFTGETGDESDRVFVLVQLWDEPDGSVAELAFRSDPSHTWGPPIPLLEEPS
jgi:hypothetical protein